MRQSFDLPFNASGDAFQYAVWSIVAEILFGATTTYGAIAQRLGDTRLSYRVGQAVGANPLCIFVPCHRLLGANGKLTGYVGGLKRKRIVTRTRRASVRDRWAVILMRVVAAKPCTLIDLARIHRCRF